MTQAPSNVEHNGTNESVVLLTDGGEDEEVVEENQTSGDEPTEAQGQEDETNILYLDVEGVFIDLLGLEIDLDEIELDVNAVSGENNLLGNLLDAVAGLLDGDIGGLPGLDLSDAIEGGMESITDSVRDSVQKALGELEAPLQELMIQLIRGVIEQLQEDSGSNEQQEAKAEA